MTNLPKYDYAVTGVRKVVDGDTVDLELDLGFYTKVTNRFRILGCDAPEHKEAGWQDSKDLLSKWLLLNTGHIRAATQKADSFGRWLADLYVPLPDGTKDHYADRLNALMAAHGWTSVAVR